jgi:dienelactone hydrolase
MSPALRTTLRLGLLAGLSTLLACAAESEIPGDDPSDPTSSTSSSSGASGSGGPGSSGGPTSSSGASGSSGTSPTPAPTPTESTPTPAPPAKFTGTATPEGCVQDITPGAHTYTCEGLTVDATIPTMTQACPAAGCGLIVVLHGDTGTGPLMDAHVRLRERAAPKGYIVVAPTGPAVAVQGYPGSTWEPGSDAKVVAIAKLFAKVFKADPKRIHATGFSRGGKMTWRLACDQSDFFASVAPGGAGNTGTWLKINQTEPSCFTAGRSPARKLPILFLMGRTDVPIPYSSMVSIRNAAMADYGITQAQIDTVTNTPQVLRQRTNKPGAGVIEWFDHTYEISTAANPLFASAKGHCIPGSPVPANAPQYALACVGPNAFDWGAEVLAFFERTAKP